MTDRDKINLIYQYFFYGEVKYRNRVVDLHNAFNLKYHCSEDLFKLYLAEHDLELFSRVMTEVLDLLNSGYYG